MNDTSPPREIQWFETVQIVSVAIGLVHQFGTPEIGLFDAILPALFIVGLTLLVSRGRNNWARWVLAVLFSLGLLLIVYSAPAIREVGISFLTVAALLLQAAGMALVFTPRSSEWLRRLSSPITAD